MLKTSTFLKTEYGYRKEGLPDHTGHRLATWTLNAREQVRPGLWLYGYLTIGCISCGSPVIMPPRRIFMNVDGSMYSETQEEANAHTFLV